MRFTGAKQKKITPIRVKVKNLILHWPMHQAHTSVIVSVDLRGKEACMGLALRISHGHFSSPISFTSQEGLLIVYCVSQHSSNNSQLTVGWHLTLKCSASLCIVILMPNCTFQKFFGGGEGMVMSLMSNGSYFGEMQSSQILEVISGETKQVWYATKGRQYQSS